MNAEIKRGSLEMTAAMLISGSIGWFVLMSGQPVVNVVFWRCAVGALVLLAVCGALGQLRRDALTRATLLLAIAGGVALVINWLLLFAAYSYASISIATAVYNTQPFMLLGLGALFLGERLTARKLLWLGLAFGGMMLVVLAQPRQAGNRVIIWRASRWRSGRRFLRPDGAGGQAAEGHAAASYCADRWRWGR